MALTSYQKGRNFEYRVKKDLEKNSFVVRQAASAFPDLIAVRECSGKKICVECRVNGRISKTERMELIRLWVKYDIHPFVARREKKKIKYYDVIFSEDVNAI